MKKPNQDVPRIEAGVKMPAFKHGVWISLFDKMIVGDSFACEASQLTGIRQAFWRLSRKDKTKTFTTRKFNGAYRCWRIK